MDIIKPAKQAKPCPELIKVADGLMAGYRKSEDSIAKTARPSSSPECWSSALGVEMTGHLGNGESGEVIKGTANTRNGVA